MEAIKMMRIITIMLICCVEIFNLKCKPLHIFSKY